MKTAFKVTFKNKMFEDSIVYANDENDAKKMGLALYRKNCTAMSFWPLDFVVDKAIKIED